MQVSALQQFDMRADSEDDNVREQVFKVCVKMVKTMVNSELGRSAPTPHARCDTGGEIDTIAL